MATYEQEVLIDTPLAFWRKRSGFVMVDASGNGNHGTFYPDAGFGFPSPIQSDASAEAVGHRVGEGDATPKPVNNLAMEVWIYCPSNSVAPLHGLTGVGQAGADGGIFIDFDSGAIGARFSTDGTTGTTVNLSYPVPALDQWYHVVLSRNSTVLELVVNGEIVDTAVTSTNPITSIYTSQPWRIGVAAIGNLWPGRGTAEPAVYDHPLTVTRARAHFEAAFNAIFLQGQSNVLSTAILLSGFDPDPISFPAMRHNWTEPLIERISFRSDISQSITGVEEGNGLRIAPRRELEFTQLIRNNTERRQLRAQLWANQHAKWFIPVRQYAERLVEPLSSGATSTPITTAYKDYETNLWIGFRQYDSAGNVEHSEERLITALNSNSIEHEALANDYAAHRSIVYPVRRALLQSSLTVKGHTDSVEEVVFTARLLPEDERVTPNRIAPFAPTIKYRDVEVFDGQLWQSHDWSEQREYEIQRAGELIDFDTGLIGFESDTAGATETFTYQMKLSGPENIAAFLGWYYERVGSLRPLWVPSMQEDFDIQFVNLSEDQIEVSGNNYSNNYALAESRRDIAFVYRDGSIRTRRVIAFEVFGSNEKLTLDADVPTLTNLRFVSLLKYCRLDADQLELAWHTDQAVVVQWRFRELPHTPEGVGVSSLSPSSSQSVSLSPSHSPSPSASVSLSPSPSASASPSASVSPSGSVSPSASGSPSSSVSLSPSLSLSPSASASPSASGSPTPSSSASGSPSPSSSASPSV